MNSRISKAHEFLHSEFPTTYISLTYAKNKQALDVICVVLAEHANDPALELEDVEDLDCAFCWVALDEIYHNDKSLHEIYKVAYYDELSDVAVDADIEYYRERI